MKQILQSNFNKEGKEYENISSPATNGERKHIESFVEDNGVVKYTSEGVEKAISVELVDNLNSTATDKGLTANQGKILNDKITTANTEISELDQNKLDIFRYATATPNITQEIARDIINNYANYEGKIIEFLTNGDAPYKTFAYGYVMSNGNGDQFLVVLNNNGTMVQWNKTDYDINVVKNIKVVGQVDCDSLTIDHEGEPARFISGLEKAINKPGNTSDYGSMIVFAYNLNRQIQMYVDHLNNTIYTRMITGTPDNHSFLPYVKLVNENGTEFVSTKEQTLTEEQKAQARTNIGVGEKSYINSTNTTAQTPIANEEIKGTINLHKISKTGEFADLNNIPSASEGAKGISQIASDSEVNTGTNTTKFITPKQLKAKIDSLGTVFNLKGTKATISELPTTNNAKGDVWYVTEKKAGYIWLKDASTGTTSDWEEFGEPIDLSGYLQKTDVVNSFVGTATDKPLSAYIGNQLYGLIAQNKVLLYGTTGDKTDGAMTQKATTEELNKKFDKTGGTISGNVTLSEGKNITANYLVGNWVQAKQTGNLNATSYDVPVLRSDGWIYKRTQAEVKSDLGISKNTEDIGTLSSSVSENTNKISGIENSLTTIEPLVAQHTTDITNLQTNKVEKQEGKGLSTNDFTNEYVNQISSNANEIQNLQNNKVSKEDGKGLSSNDFTTDFANQIEANTGDIATLQTSKQNKLNAGANITIDEDTNTISASSGTAGTQVTVGGVVQTTWNADTKVNTVSGKGLSTNDFTTAEKTQISTNTSDIADLKTNKVSKEIGKGLSTNDFTDTYVNDIANLKDNTFKINGAYNGFSAGSYSDANGGGAIGFQAKAGYGFSGGRQASVAESPSSPEKYIDAIQLGGGRNDVPRSLQVYGDNLYDAKNHKLGVGLLEAIYPIGTIYISIYATSPAEKFGGTWEALATGKTLWTTSANDGGQSIEAGLPNITGEVGSLLSSGRNTGAFQNRGNDPSSNWGGSDRWNNTNTSTFDASRSSGVYGKSTTVQPPAIKVHMWKRTA